MGLLRLISCLIFLILILDSEGLSFGRFGGFKSGGFKSGGGFKFGGGFKSGGFKSGGLKTGGFKWGGSKGSSKGGSFGKSGGGKTRLSTTYYSSSNHLNYGWNYHETPPSHYSRSSKAPYDPPVGFTMYKRPGAENTIAKEAAVHSTTAVVVTHVVPGGIYGTWGSPWGPTYYYQSNGQKKRPKTTSSPNAPGFTTWSGRNVTLNEFQNLTEDLLKKDVNNAAKFITIKLQGQKTDNSTNDIAPEPLLTVKNEAWSIPTVKAVLDLHDNYNMDIHVKEVTTDHEAKEQDEFLDLILQTEIMNDTMKFLVDNGYVKNNRTEFKKTLRDIWFWQFGRTDGDAGSSGFESVFLAEKFDSDIIGLHNWIYYAKMEANGTLNYLGYIRNATLGDKGALLKVRSSLNGTVQPVTSFFVGTSPELEIALYTLCFYALPNHLCPVKLAGNDVVIMVNAYSIDSKNITASAYPDFRRNSAPAQTPFAILGVMSLLVSLIIFNPLNTGLL